MNGIIDQTNWSSFLVEYSALNRGQRTRLGVFESRNGAANDYWIEDGLPLVAVDIYRDKDKTRVDILFENYTHSIESVETLVQIGAAGGEGGLDIVDAEGTTTVMRFETWPTSGKE